MRLKLSNVSSKYGAPMGRPKHIPNDMDERELPVKLRMVRLRWVGGDYDQGGAYWGNSGGTSIYWAIGYLHEGDPKNEELVEIFTRSETRNEAKNKVRETLPNAKFHN